MENIYFPNDKIDLNDYINGITLTGARALEYYFIELTPIKSILEIETEIVSKNLNLNNTYFINNGFKGVKEYDSVKNIFYVDKNKALFDLISTKADIDVLEKAIDLFKLDGYWDEFKEYALKYGLAKSIIDEYDGWQIQI
jgi:hypothetical protein